MWSQMCFKYLNINSTGVLLLGGSREMMIEFSIMD